MSPTRPNLGDGSPADPVLLQGSATVEVNDLLAAVGELTITTQRIRFRPNRVENLVGLAAAFDDPVDAISGFEITGARHRLEVRSASRTVRFMGDVVPGVYGALQALAEVASGEVKAEHLGFRLVPASLCRGPVMHPGALVFTGTRLAFVATGFLDSLVGVHALTEIPVGAITNLTLSGRLDPRIEVGTVGARLIFACADAANQYERAVAWLAEHLPGPMVLGGAAATGPVATELDRVIGPYRGLGALAEAPLMFTPAVALSANSPATPGWLFVGAESMVWLPGPTPSVARPPVSLPLGRERWIWGEPAAEIRADREGIPYRWVTRLGVPFRQALFEQVERIRKRIALAWASSGTGVIADGQNRRDSYRVQVMEQGQPAIGIWVATEGEFRQLSCKIIELSLGGCSIRTAAQLPLDLLARVDLAESGRVCSVRARVAYTRQGMHDQRSVAGLVFIEPPSDFDTVLRHMWMSLQQQQLKRLRGGGEPT